MTVRLPIVAALIFLGLPGCTNHDWMIRKPAVESTIGHDPNRAPAGTVIAPAGLGVDLG